MNQMPLLHITLRNAVIGYNAGVSYPSHLSLIAVSGSCIHTINNVEMLLDSRAIMKMKASYVNQTSPLHIALHSCIHYNKEGLKTALGDRRNQCMLLNLQCAIFFNCIEYSGPLAIKCV